MKKYQQLLIVSLGLVSFICFLIYKHEYDRLRNVLEVLEVFGSPPPQNDRIRLHSLDDDHNPALMPGSINELNLGIGGNHNYDNHKHTQVDDTFISKNGHGVKPPDNDLAAVEDLKANHVGNKANPNVIQNPIQNSGEVVDNLVDDGGRDDGVIGKIGALKAKKAVQQRQDSIFKDRQKLSNDV